MAPGATASFDISVTTEKAGRVDLAVSSVPDGWTAVLRGGGFTIDGVETDGTTTPTKVTLNVTVPADATGGTTRITVKGTTSSGASTSLTVDIRVTPNAAGDVTLTTDTPQLKGASNASFSFSLTLNNDTPDDLPFSVTATGPDGWTVTAQIGSQAQAASVVVKAGSIVAGHRQREGRRCGRRRRLPDRGRRDQRQPVRARRPLGRDHRELQPLAVDRRPAR